MSAQLALSPAEDIKKAGWVREAANMTAFGRLPDEIIELILQLANPNCFASLIILNRKWRAVSQQAHLYTRQLSRCPSYSAAHHAVQLPDDEQSLPRLRKLFAREIKRNLFEAYLRPRETIISLVSTSISSSSAPGGEAFHFSLSPRGHYVLAYSSSRIHVIDVTGPEVTVMRELKILRRPASTTITDDGSLLAVLSTDMQVDLYDLTSEHPKHTRAVALDHTPRTIALSPTGAVLAAAYDSGVEVSSLDPSCISTDRRAVKCYAVDSLSFSRDGTQLLGSTTQSRNPSTVVLTAPYYDPGGSLPEESVSALWTTSILFPNGSRDCSHAVLLPSPSEGEASWTFTYDRVFETFRAVRIDDLRNGTTYFTGPTSDSASVSKLLPSTLPSASEAGDLVASGFQGAIWIYGVPEDLEALPQVRDGTLSNAESEVSTPTSPIARRNSAPSLRSVGKARESMARIPQWQLLCDRLRNTFVEGRKITTLDRVSSMAWVQDYSTSFHSERLVAVAPGVGGLAPTSEDDGMTPVDGGRISILDFDYSPDDGIKSTITIEVGMSEPDVLEEEHRDLDTEVAIVRRRTVAQRRGNRSHVSRAATSAARTPPPPVPAMPSLHNRLEHFTPRVVRRPSQQTTMSENSEGVSVDEDQEVFEAPYSQTDPRSGNTLRRAATAAAVNRRFHPRAAAQDHIEYRRADGREEHPHESDADNWVPPPPPYTRDPIPPLPEHIQRSLLAEAAAASLQRANTHRAPSADFPGLESPGLSRSRTVATTASSRSADSRRERYQFQRTFSDSTNMNTDRISLEEDTPRPMTSPSTPGFDDLYDVSPPETPEPAPRQLVQQTQIAQVNHIPRRPVGAPPNAQHVTQTPSPAQSDVQTPPQPPVSPVPQATPPANVALETRLEEWENEPVPDRPSSSVEASPSLRVVPAGHSRLLSHGSMIDRPVSQQSDLLKDVPPRPDEDHHLTELPPTTPVMPNQRNIIESRPATMPRRSETAPVMASPPEGTEENHLPIWRRETAPAAPKDPENMSGLAMPSPDQLARLNSRRGRPSGLGDPRRMSGISNHQTNLSSSSHSRNVSDGSARDIPPQMRHDFPLRNTPPRAAGGGRTSPQNYAPQYPTINMPRSMPTRRPSGNSRIQGNASPGLRPPMQRLETIHSQTSAGEPSPYFAQKSLMVSRHSSRAERGAAKNIKDAKKRGWRSSMKEKKTKKKEEQQRAQSSAGWTDVTRDSDMARHYDDASRAGKEKGTKCAIM